MDDGSRCYSDRLVDQIDAAVQRYRHGDDVMFELIMGLVPEQQGGAAFVATMILTIPGAQLNTTSMNVQRIAPLGITEAQLDECVRDGIEQLRLKRSKDLDALKSGLHLPGT